MDTFPGLVTLYTGVQYGSERFKRAPLLCVCVCVCVGANRTRVDLCFALVIISVTLWTFIAIAEGRNRRCVSHRRCVLHSRVLSQLPKKFIVEKPSQEVK